MITQFCLYGQRCIGHFVEAVSLELSGANNKVTDFHLGHRSEVCTADDAGQAEHILCLQETAVAVAIHLYGHHLLGLLRVDEAGDVEAGRIAGVLGEAHVMAVYPQVEEGIHTVEVDQNLPPAPIARQGECAQVAANFVPILHCRPLLVPGFAHHTAPPVIHSHLMLEDDLLIHVDGQPILQ